MLNLQQTHSQIKSAGPVMLYNPASPTWINNAYRELKSLGWRCLNSEVHPTDRVPVFRLGNATLRRDKDNPGAWLVDAVGGEWRFEGDLSQITADVQAMEADLLAQDDGNGWGSSPALSPEQEAAADLKAQYPHLAGRIDSALALVEAGVVEFPKYQTSNVHTNGGRNNRDCQCPDAEFRGFRVDFGIACKHTLVQEIVDRARRITNRLVINELTEQQDARRRMLPADVLAPTQTAAAIVAAASIKVATNAGLYEAAMQADPLNLRRDNRAEFGRRIY